MSKKPTNDNLIQEYLNFYQHSEQSVRMRKSCLNYFFKEKIYDNKTKKETKVFNYQDHIFNITTKTIKQYFIWLKNLDTVNISTRKNKFTIFLGLLENVMEDYDDFIVKIPRRKLKWNGAAVKKGKVKSNKNVYATKEELKKILKFLKGTNFKHYLIIRLLIETGARKGEIINLKMDEINLEKGYINPHKGKTGPKYYFFTEKLAKQLELYLNGRKMIKTDSNHLFITKFKTQYADRMFNLILKNVFIQENINQNITCHTFRKTLNDFRKDMGCQNEDRKILLGHKTSDTNVKNYTKNDLETLRKLYDTWNPYENLNF